MQIVRSASLAIGSMRLAIIFSWSACENCFGLQSFPMIHVHLDSDVINGYKCLFKRLLLLGKYVYERLLFVQSYLRHKIPQTSNLQLAYSSMMNKTAVQKRLIAVSVWGGCDVLWRGGGLGHPKPKPSYVPVGTGLDNKFTRWKSYCYCLHWF